MPLKLTLLTEDEKIYYLNEILKDLGRLNILPLSAELINAYSVPLSSKDENVDLVVNLKVKFTKKRYPVGPES